MLKNQHILFIHIPKTAGTSFRVSAQEYYEENEIFYDYSPHAKETSPSIVEMIYESKDFYGFYSKVLSPLDKSFLSGHFHSTKYGALYDTLNVVSFVRNPIEQVISHYNHYKNRHGYTESFSIFIQESRFCNLQSKLLASKPIGMYGLLAITEEYDTAILLFNRLYNTKLESQYINRKSKDALHSSELEDEIITLIERLNSKDMIFYKKVQAQFEVRKELYAKGLDFTYGFIQKATMHEISGIAFQKDNKNAIEIDIYAGEVYLATVEAKNLRAGQKDVPRKGYIGFDYVYDGEYEAHEKLSAFNRVTKQEIL
ncbi:MAG: sulfotransferase family 2 domain-containing protein [Sulfurovum sp.]|nr:sulfotransferase family 2 domain-containing protein [Sulfurovum sp.]